MNTGSQRDLANSRGHGMNELNRDGTMVASRAMWACHLCLYMHGLVLVSGTSSAFVRSPALQQPPRHSQHRQQDTFRVRRGSHLGVAEKDTPSVSSGSIDLAGPAIDALDALDQERFLEEMEMVQLDENNMVVDDPVVAVPPSQQLPDQSAYWKYRGHDIFRQVALPKKPRTGAPAVILVHGFGCSTVYWRETIKALTAQGYEVHAIDLLGQGKSAKPTEDVEYSINLWAEQVDTYARENLPGKEIVLIGNSVGSLVSLVAATGDFVDEHIKNGDAITSEDQCYVRQHIAGIGEFNCGIGMNIRNILKDPKWNPVQKYLLNVAFDVLETLVFGNSALLTFIMEKLVTRDMLRNALRDLYSCASDPDAKIDEKLVDSFYLPAKEEGSPLVLRQILTNNAGLTPMELHERHKEFLDSLPIHVVWGDEDKVIPIEWQVPKFLNELSKGDNNAVTMDVVHGGHVVFDERPEDSNGSMLSWLHSLKMTSN